MRKAQAATTSRKIAETEAMTGPYFENSSLTPKANAKNPVLERDRSTRAKRHTDRSDATVKRILTDPASPVCD